VDDYNEQQEIVEQQDDVGLENEKIKSDNEAIDGVEIKIQDSECKSSY
jgi:hypothetical protein